MSALRTLAHFTRMVVLIFGMFGKISTRPSENTVKECRYLHDTQTVKYELLLNEAARQRHCNPGFYDLNGLFPCDNVGYQFIKTDCLKCGLATNNTAKGLCKNNKDNPERYLTCADCMKHANPCKNGGKVHCGPRKVYAYEMECHCSNKYYYGRYCQYLKYACINDDNDYGCQNPVDNPLKACSKMTLNGKSYICQLSEEDESSFRDKPPCMKQDLPLNDMEKRDQEDGLTFSLDSYLTLYDIEPQIKEELYDEI